MFLSQVLSPSSLSFALILLLLSLSCLRAVLNTISGALESNTKVLVKKKKERRKYENIFINNSNFCSYALRYTKMSCIVSYKAGFQVLHGLVCCYLITTLWLSCAVFAVLYEQFNI